MPNMDSSESDGRRCVFSYWFGQDVFACGDGELLTESSGLLGVRYRPEALRRNERPSMLLSPTIVSNCFGVRVRLRGQKRVPRPPARMTA